MKSRPPRPGQTPMFGSPNETAKLIPLSVDDPRRSATEPVGDRSARNQRRLAAKAVAKATRGKSPTGKRPPTFSLVFVPKDGKSTVWNIPTSREQIWQLRDAPTHPEQHAGVRAAADPRAELSKLARATIQTVLGQGELKDKITDRTRAAEWVLWWAIWGNDDSPSLEFLRERAGLEDIELVFASSADGQYIDITVNHQHATPSLPDMPIYRYTTADGRMLRVAIWNGGGDFTRELPGNIIRCVGGDEIIIPQVGSPTNGAGGGRSSTKLTEALARIQPKLGGVIHWARDDETYTSIAAELAAEWPRIPWPILPEDWRPTVTVIPVGSGKPPIRSIDNLILAGAEVRVANTPIRADSNDMMEGDSTLAKVWEGPPQQTTMSRSLFDKIADIARSLMGNMSATAASKLLDGSVGRGNWRYDPKQETWLLRSVEGGKVYWGGIHRKHGVMLNLPEDHAAAWWQRLAAGGGPQSQLPHFAETMRALGDDKLFRSTVRGYFDEQEIKKLLANAKVISRYLHSAHKFKWDRSFSRMVWDVAESRPQTLLNDLLVTARLPYESANLWFEWERQLETPEVWGALILPYQNAMAQALVATPRNGIAPGVLLFDFRNPISFVGHGHDYEPTTPQNWMVLGPDYINRWHKGNHAVLDQLSRYAAVKFSGPLYGDRPAEIWDSAPDDDVELKLGLGRIAATVGGIFRELLSGWALAVTHIDDEPLVEMTTIKAPTFHIGGGRFRPSYQYKNIVWRRPQELPKLLRKIRRIVRHREGTPQSEVSGHWAHRRAPNKDCAVHPRACGRRRQWRSVKRPEGLWGHDDKPQCPNDYQKCIYCDHVRWWVIDHKRGDPKYGIIEKTYTITASRRRHRPPDLGPPMPVEPPPAPAPQLNAEADDE